MNYARFVIVNTSFRGVQFASSDVVGASCDLSIQKVALVSSSFNYYWAQINVGTVGNEFVCEGGLRVYPEKIQVFMTVFEKGVGTTVMSKDFPSGYCSIRLERSIEDLKTWSMYVDSKLFHSYTFSREWVGSPSLMLETRGVFEIGQANLQVCSWSNIEQKTFGSWADAVYRGGLTGYGAINAYVNVLGSSSFLVNVQS